MFREQLWRVVMTVPRLLDQVIRPKLKDTEKRLKLRWRDQSVDQRRTGTRGSPMLGIGRRSTLFAHIEFMWSPNKVLVNNFASLFY